MPDALHFGYTKFDDKDVNLIDLSGGGIFNHSFSLCLAGNFNGQIQSPFDCGDSLKSGRW